MGRGREVSLPRSLSFRHLLAGAQFIALPPKGTYKRSIVVLCNRFGEELAALKKQREGSYSQPNVIPTMLDFHFRFWATDAGLERLIQKMKREAKRAAEWHSLELDEHEKELQSLRSSLRMRNAVSMFRRVSAGKPAGVGALFTEAKQNSEGVEFNESKGVVATAVVGAGDAGREIGVVGVGTKPASVPSSGEEDADVDDKFARAERIRISHLEAAKRERSLAWAKADRE